MVFGGSAKEPRRKAIWFQGKVVFLLALGFAASLFYWCMWFYYRPVISVVDHSEEFFIEPPDYERGYVQITVTFKNKGLISGSSQFIFSAEWNGGNTSKVVKVTLEPSQITTITVTLEVPNEDISVRILPDYFV
jgi:hypothetical protein